MENLILNNGKFAVFLKYDNFARPVYNLESGVKVVSTEFCPPHNLHTISSYGEPEYPLHEDYQPVDMNWYEGVRDQDGWETLELTVRNDHPQIADAILKELKQAMQTDSFNVEMTVKKTLLANAIIKKFKK